VGLVAGDVGADMQRKAEAFAAAAAAQGQPLDYSLESLVALDALLDSLFARRWALRSGGRLDTKRFAPMIEPVGAYLGEALRHTLGGEWDHDDDAVDGPRLRLPSGTVVAPVEQAHRRFEAGHEAALGVLAASLAHEGEP
jgi:hypothetical protein